jgi:hypothetical protein
MSTPCGRPAQGLAGPYPLAMDDDLPTQEQARNRRRDRDMAAEERAPMNNAANKWFEQVIASQQAKAQGDRPKRTKRRKSKR